MFFLSKLDLAYKDCLVDGATSSLWHSAKAIHKLEFSSGVIPNVRAKRKSSICVADILNRMQAEESVNSSNIVAPEINTLILLAMEVDMVTPMCSQLTYEGLLDEFLHVNNGSVELDASFMGVQQEGKKMKVLLNSSDKLFKEIRDLNFEVVVQVLRQKATSMKQDYTEMTTTTVSELKGFVKKLNSLPEMTFSCTCFEYIEEMIHKQEPLVNVLRLLILFSTTNASLPKKNFDYLRRELLHSYGFEHMASLGNLEKAGLFKKQESKSNWLTIKQTLQLVIEDTDTAKFANSASYDALQGASMDKMTTDGRRSLVLVVFIGGVTCAEISALRFLSAQEGMAYDLIIGTTTKLVSGRSLMEAFIETIG